MDAPPELQRARSATLRSVMAAHPGATPPGIAFWAIDFQHMRNGILLSGNAEFADICDLPTVPVGAPSTELFLPPSSFFYRSPELLDVYRSSMEMSLSFASAICKGLAPRAEGRCVQISRVGRLTAVAFSLAGVYVDGHLREAMVALWRLPTQPPGTPYVVDGQLCNLPLAPVQLAFAPQPCEHTHLAQADLFLSRLHSASLQPASPSPSSPLLQASHSYPPTIASHEANPSDVESDATSQLEGWRCDFCGASHTPEKRYGNATLRHPPFIFRLALCFSSASSTLFLRILSTGPRGPRTLCNACGIKFGALRRAEAKAAASRRDQKGRFVAIT